MTAYRSRLAEFANFVGPAGSPLKDVDNLLSNSNEELLRAVRSHGRLGEFCKAFPEYNPRSPDYDSKLVTM